MRFSTLSAAVLTLAFAANGQSALPISVGVPENCEVSFSPVTVTPPQSDLQSEAFESCNNGDGFVVRAYHRPLLPGESVKLVYASAASHLTGDSFTDITIRSGAKYGEQPVLIQVSELQSDLSLTLAAEPVTY